MVSMAASGRGTPGGGISRLRSLSRMRSQPSRCFASESGAWNGPASKPPEASLWLWHGAHVVASTGATVLSNAAEGLDLRDGPAAAAHGKQPATTMATEPRTYLCIALPLAANQMQL